MRDDCYGNLIRCDLYRYLGYGSLCLLKCHCWRCCRKAGGFFPSHMPKAGPCVSASLCQFSSQKALYILELQNPVASACIHLLVTWRFTENRKKKN